MTMFSRVLRVLLLSLCLHSTEGAPAVFQNDLSIQNLFISNPYQADVTSSYHGTLNVVVRDGDYPDLKPVHCQIEWKAGVGPPDTTKHQCENATTRVWFPQNTFKGIRDFQLQFARTVIDTSIGECPRYCYLTKYASLNLTYPSTANWDCDMETATCQQQINSTIKAPVYLAVAQNAEASRGKIRNPL